MNENMYLEQKNEKMGENSFMKKLLKKRLNQKGLTLIELLAVIVILAIIAAIAIPAITGLINTQRDKAILAEAQTIIAGAKLANTSGACGSDGVCDNEELQPFVDGVTLAETDQVAVSGWTLTWGGLTGFSTGSDFAITSPATEAAILALLNP